MGKTRPQISHYTVLYVLIVNKKTKTLKTYENGFSSAIKNISAGGQSAICYFLRCHWHCAAVCAGGKLSWGLFRMRLVQFIRRSAPYCLVCSAPLGRLFKKLHSNWNALSFLFLLSIIIFATSITSRAGVQLFPRIELSHISKVFSCILTRQSNISQVG